MNKFYVYQLIDSRDNKVFYVGKGSSGRHLQHLEIAKDHYINNKSTKGTDNPKLYNKLIKFFKLNLEVQFDFPYGIELEENEAFKLEGELTRSIGLNKLCNLKHGGKGGTAGYIMSLESRKKNSEGQKLHWKNKSPELIAEQEAKRKETRNNKTLEEKAELSRVKSENAKLMHAKRTPEQQKTIYDKVQKSKVERQVYIKLNTQEFKSKISEGHIRFHAQNPNHITTNYIPVLKLCPETNKIIKEFKNMCKAEESINSEKPPSLRYAIQNNKLKCGFKWMKKEDYIKLQEQNGSN